MNSIIYISGIMDTLNDWNEKLNSFAGGHMDNVWVGALVVGLVFVVAAWAIRTFTKK